MAKSGSEQNYIVGLDIGTTKIAVAVGRENENGKIEIVGFGKTESLGVRRGLVSNIESTVESIKTAVLEAEEASNVKITNVVVGIAGQHIRSMKQPGNLVKKDRCSVITKEDIDQMISEMYNLAINPGDKVIDVIPQEYTIDQETGITNPVGMIGSSIETTFHVIIAQLAAVQNILRCVEMAGLTLDALVLEPIASSSSALSEEEKEAGVVLVDIGGGTTDIAIFHEHILRYTSVIPFGGDVITNDIRQGCSLISKYAEDLKVKFGSALMDKNKEEEIVVIPGLRNRPPREISLVNLAAIIQSRMQEILEQVAYEIKRSGCDKKIAGGVVLTGGGSLLKHVIQLAEFVVGKEVRIGYPDECIAQGTDKALISPIYSTVIGLVKIGVEKEKDKNNGCDNEGGEEEVNNTGRKTKKPGEPRKSFSERIEALLKSM